MSEASTTSSETSRASRIFTPTKIPRSSKGLHDVLNARGRYSSSHFVESVVEHITSCARDTSLSRGEPPQTPKTPKRPQRTGSLKETRSPPERSQQSPRRSPREPVSRSPRSPPKLPQRSHDTPLRKQHSRTLSNTQDGVPESPKRVGSAAPRFRGVPNDVPGPGHYNDCLPRFPRRAPRLNTTAPQRPSMSPSSRSAANAPMPGPGAYDCPSTLSAGPKHSCCVVRRQPSSHRVYSAARFCNTRCVA